MTPSEKTLIPIYLINDIEKLIKTGINLNVETSKEALEFIQRLEYLFIKLSDSLENLPKASFKNLNKHFELETPIIQQLKYLRNNLEHNNQFISNKQKQELFNNLFSGANVNLKLQNGSTFEFQMFNLSEIKRSLLKSYEVYVEQKL